MAEPRPNFFEILDLDPSVDSWETIRTSISKKKQEWNHVRTQRTGKAKAKAEQLLGLIPEMERVLSDASLRALEAQARRDQLRAQQDEVYKELDQRIEMFRPAGQISQAALGKLVEQFAGRLPRQAVEERLSAAGVRVAGGDSGAPPPFVPREFLTDSEFGEIQHFLEVIRAADLYSFLGLPQDSASERLAARGKQIYQENAGRTDDASTARQKLGGIAEAIFSKSQGKDRYDASRATWPMRQLHGNVELMVEDGELRYEAFDLLANLARKHKVDPGLAKSYFGWYAQQRGWTIAEPPQVPTPEYPSPDDPPQDPPQTETPQPPGPPIKDPPPRPTTLRAPQTLQVTPARRGFDLAWPAVPEPGVSYWVVRKAESPPQDEGDGTGVEVVDTRFQDRDVPAGTWYYAVFTLRQDQTSLSPACSGPHRQARQSAAPKAAAAAAVLLGVAAFVAYHAGLFAPQPSPAVVSQPEAEQPPEDLPVQSAATAPLPPPQLPPAPPPPPPDKIRQEPKVIVVAAGGQQIANSLEARLTAELAQLGLDAESGRGRFLTGDYVARGGNTSALALLQTLDKEDADILVFADIQSLGQRELRFLGRSEISYSAQINARAYLVRDRSQLGGMEVTQLEYTSLNLEKNLADSIYKIGGSLESAARSGWSRYRRDRGLSP